MTTNATAGEQHHRRTKAVRRHLRLPGSLSSTRARQPWAARWLASNRYPTVLTVTIGPAGRRREFAAQIADVDVDDVRARVVLVPPDGAEDLLTGQHLSGVAHQVMEQLELGLRESRSLAPRRDLAAEQVHFDVRRRATVVAEDSVTARSCARMRAASSAQRERLRQVIDHARIETGDAILDVAARGQRDHRQTSV